MLRHSRERLRGMSMKIRRIRVKPMVDSNIRVKLMADRNIKVRNSRIRVGGMGTKSITKRGYT